MMQKYYNSTIESVAPHLFSVAELSYKMLREKDTSVSLLISGESGAGKNFLFSL